MPAMEADPPIDPQTQELADQVLAVSRSIRSHKRATRAALIADIDRTKNREASNEVILAGALGQLMCRMRSLYQQPMSKRLFHRPVARSTVPVTIDSERFKISTPPITDGDILQIHGVHYLRSGLVYATDAGKPCGVTIYQAVQDELTNTQRRRELYRLYPYDSKTGPRVSIKEQAFDAYLRTKEKEIRAEYALHHPWAAEPAYCYWIPAFSSDPTDGGFVSLDFNSPTSSESKTRAEQLNRELSPHMAPGTSWEYPDEMFNEPLGLVLEANMLLGSGK